MTPAEVLATANRLGIVLQVRDDWLTVDAPSGAVTPELRSALTKHKGNLLALFQLLARLQAGSRWLTTQHHLWLADDPGAASDEYFSRALAAWGDLERALRDQGYEGCIFGPAQKCLEDAPVCCVSCVGSKSEPRDSACVVCRGPVSNGPAKVYLADGGVRHDACRLGP